MSGIRRILAHLFLEISSCYSDGSLDCPCETFRWDQLIPASWELRRNTSGPAGSLARRWWPLHCIWLGLCAQCLRYHIDYQEPSHLAAFARSIENHVLRDCFQQSYRMDHGHVLRMRIWIYYLVSPMFQLNCSTLTRANDFSLYQIQFE